jgi:hypothetical protein
MGYARSTDLGPGAAGLEVEHLGIGRQINQVRSAVHCHVGIKVGLVYLTGIGTGRSDADGNLVFYQIRQVVSGAVTRAGAGFKIPCFIRPQHTVIVEKQVDLVSFVLGYLGKLETACCTVDVISAQRKNEMAHGLSPPK